MPRSAPDPKPTVPRTTRPHDALFKAAFEQPEHAAALLRESFDQSISEAIDWKTIAPYPGSFIDPNLADFHSDLLFTVQLNGSQALLYVLLEHQSTEHAYMPLRMLHYMTLVWLRYCKEHDPPMPVLLSLLITHAPGGWNGPRTFTELLEPDPATIPGLAPLVPSFSLTLLDLAHVTNEQLKGSALDAFQQLAIWLLRDARNAAAFLDHLPSWKATFRQAYRTPHGMEALRQLVSYICIVCGALQRDEFLAKIRNVLPEAEPIFMTIAEQYIQEGLEKGRAEGRAAGLEEGRAEHLANLRATLRKLLSLKFGPPSPEVEARIAAASVEELDRYIERVVFATDLAAVFAA